MLKLDIRPDVFEKGCAFRKNKEQGLTKLTGISSMEARTGYRRHFAELHKQKGSPYHHQNIHRRLLRQQGGKTASKAARRLLRQQGGKLSNRK